jgi:hypothetical protein
MSTPCPRCGTPVDVADTPVSSEITTSASEGGVHQDAAPEPAAATSAQPPKADVGVLFVHGIGQPVRGDTLIRFGDPVCRWIKSWLDGAKPSKSPPNEAAAHSSITFDANDGILRQRMDDGEAPPRATVQFGATVNGVAHNNKWLLAESRWADAFPTTRFQDLAWWGLLVAPWTSASHYALRIRRLFKSAMAKPAPARIPALLLFLPLAAWYLLTSLLGSCVLLLLILLLLALAIPPIPQVRAFVVRVQRALSSSLGDCYVLIASPIRRAAIIGQVVRDLRWMEARCARLAIIAHSQGGAVAFEALRTRVFAGCDEKRFLLLTFGSGLTKLEELRRSQQHKAWMFYGWGPIIGLYFILGSLFWSQWPTLQHLTDVDGPTMFLAGAALWFFCSLYAIRLKRFAAPEFDPVTQFGVGITWRDYYASADPVPNGPLFDKEDEPGYLASGEVHNFASMWRDHTTYWTNVDGFVSQVVVPVAQLGQFPITALNGEDKARVTLAPYRRRWRVGCLRAVRVAAVAIAVLSLVRNWSEVQTIGTDLVTVLGDTGKTWLVDPLQRWAGLTDAGVRSLIGAAASLLLFGVPVYLLLYGCWRLWNYLDTQALFSRKDYGLVMFWVVAFLTYLSAIVAWQRSPLASSDGSTEADVVLLAPPMLVAALTYLRQRIAGLGVFECRMRALFGGIFAAALTAPIIVMVAPALSSAAQIAMVTGFVLAGFTLVWIYDAWLGDRLKTVACVGDPSEALRRLGM